jgi:hypothetical protein
MKIKIFKRGLVVSFLALFLFVQFYSLTEYSFAVVDNVVVTLDVDSGISISDGAAVTMAPNISISSNSSIGSSSWTVITNGANGYSLSVNDSTDPALKSATDSFANYTEAVTGTPEAWSVPSGSKEFGYSAYGTDTPTATWGTAASCGAAGVPSGTQKYVGFLPTPTTKIIATRATVTPFTGVTTTICFAAEQDGIFAAAGTYTATITGTAVTL